MLFFYRFWKAEGNKNSLKWRTLRKKTTWQSMVTAGQSEKPAAASGWRASVAVDRSSNGPGPLSSTSTACGANEQLRSRRKTPSSVFSPSSGRTFVSTKWTEYQQIDGYHFLRLYNYTRVHALLLTVTFTPCTRGYYIHFHFGSKSRPNTHMSLLALVRTDYRYSTLPFSQFSRKQATFKHTETPRSAPWSKRYLKLIRQWTGTSAGNSQVFWYCFEVQVNKRARGCCLLKNTNFEAVSWLNHDRYDMIHDLRWDNHIWWRNIDKSTQDNNLISNWISL